MNQPVERSSPYGPNTPQLRRFLVQFAGLGRESRAEVVRVYLALSESRAYHAAEQLLASAIERTDRTDAQNALAGPLLQLVQKPHGDTADDVTFDAIAEPALAALLALMVADVLDSATVDLLYSPFESWLPRASLV